MLERLGGIGGTVPRIILSYGLSRQHAQVRDQWSGNWRTIGQFRFTLTTAMLSCMVLQPAASRSWSVFRALPPGLFRPLLQQLHWLPVRQRITYKLAVLIFKIRHTATPVYLSRLITARVCSRTQRSSTAPLLSEPFHKLPFRDALSAALHLPPGTLCRTLWLLLTHWHLLNLG